MVKDPKIRRRVKRSRKSLSPDTTAQQDSTQDTTLAGQRRINLIWEVTQSVIALAVVVSTAIGVFIARVMKGDATGAFPAEWWTIVGLVIGFYFSRTNHQAIGGTGGRPISPPYEGR